MNYAERREFRKSKAWKKFRAKCRLHCSKDFITNKPLERDWNLHHLDTNHSRYDQITDMDRFVPLNPKTHELIHEIYKLYKRDPMSLTRIVQLIIKMDTYSNESSNTQEDRK